MISDGILYLLTGAILFGMFAHGTHVLNYSTHNEWFKITCGTIAVFSVIASEFFWGFGLYYLFPEVSFWGFIGSFWVLMGTPLYFVTLSTLIGNPNYPGMDINFPFVNQKPGPLNNKANKI